MDTCPVHVTVVTCNRLELTKRCLGSLLGRTEGKFSVQVVDNASSDGTWPFLQRLAREDDRIRVTRLARNMGVAVAANYGWAQREDAFHLKLDNDVEILAGDWLARLMEYARECPRLGALGYRCLSRHAVTPVRLPGGRPFWNFATCGGACVLIPPAVHRSLGFWNEDYGKYGFEDMEYSLRCRLLSLTTGYVPLEDRVRHLGYERPERAYEAQKHAQVASGLSGENAYFLNKLLFEEGVRPLKVARRFLPVEGTDPVRFGPNPAYAGMVRFLNSLRRGVGLSRDGETVRLDMSRWKTARERDR